MRYRRALPPWQRLGQCGGAAPRGGRCARVPGKRKSLWHSAAGLLSGEEALYRGVQGRRPYKGGGRTPPPRCARPAGPARPTGRQGAARRKEGIGRGQSSTHQTLQRGAAPGPLCFPGVTGGRPRRTHDSCDQPRHLHNRKDKEKLHATVRQSFRVCTTRRARDAPAPQRTAQRPKARPPGERENPVIARPRSAPTAAELAAGGKPARGRPGRRAAHRAAVPGLAHHRKNHLRDPTDGTASPAPDAVMATHPCHFCHAPFHVLTDACHSAARCSNSGPAARAADM